MVTKVQKKIAVDLDDVLGDWVTPYLVFYNQKFNTSYQKDDISPCVRGFLDFFPQGETTIIKSINEFYNTELVKTMEPLPEAKKSISKLKEMGFELFVVTSRPNSCHKLTRHWIESHFGNHFSNIHFADKALGGKNGSKVETLHQLGIQYFVDDMLRFAYECKDSEIQVLLFDMPWNRITNLPSKITRVHSWPEIVKFIGEKEEQFR